MPFKMERNGATIGKTFQLQHRTQAMTGQQVLSGFGRQAQLDGMMFERSRLEDARRVSLEERIKFLRTTEGAASKGRRCQFRP